MPLDAGGRLSYDEWADMFDMASQRAQSAPIVDDVLSGHIVEIGALTSKWHTGEFFMGQAARVGNTGMNHILSRHGVSVDHNHHSYAPNATNLPPPIIIAKAWSQTEAVQVLKELGAKDISPLDSI